MVPSGWRAASAARLLRAGEHDVEALDALAGAALDSCRSPRRTIAVLPSAATPMSMKFEPFTLLTFVEPLESRMKRSPGYAFLKRSSSSSLVISFFSGT